MAKTEGGMEKKKIIATVHLNKRIHKIKFKKRAPRAISEIKKFAAKTMGTKDVNIDTSLNQYIWSHGIRKVPRRVRIMMERKQKSSEFGDGDFYTTVAYIPTTSFKNLITVNVYEDEAENAEE